MGLGKDEQGCPTMRQFADFAAQFADFVVTLHVPPENPNDENLDKEVEVLKNLPKLDLNALATPETEDDLNGSDEEVNDDESQDEDA